MGIQPMHRYSVHELLANRSILSARPTSCIVGPSVAPAPQSSVAILAPEVQVKHARAYRCSRSCSRASWPPHRSVHTVQYVRDDDHDEPQLSDASSTDLQTLPMDKVISAHVPGQAADDER